MRLLSFLSAGLFADSVNDADSTRKVYLLAGGLVALGIGLIAITVWFWRNTRHDPELLAPLEAMSTKGFHKLDGRAQQLILDSARPPDAEPMRWGVTRGESEPIPEVVDLRAIAKSAQAEGYDDLRDDVVAAEQPIAEYAESAKEESEAEAESVSADSADPDLRDSDSGDSDDIGSVDGEAGSADPAGLVAESVIDHEDAEISDDTTDPADQATGPVDAASVDEASVDEASVDETAETELDEFAILDEVAASTEIVGEDPVTTAEVIPLLIVPIDHDLHGGSARPELEPASRPSAGSSGGSPDRFAGHDDAAADALEPPARDVRPSIDPLIRKFDRNDR